MRMATRGGAFVRVLHARAPCPLYAVGTSLPRSHFCRFYKGRRGYFPLRLEGGEISL